MTAAPAVSVVVVTYDSVGVIRSCLDALAVGGGAPAGLEVLVVDNLSRDDTVAVLRAEYPWVRLIENTENAGFSRAVNLGAAHAKGRNLLLLNPDAQISATAVTALSALLDEDPSVGAVSPLLENEGEEVVIVAAGHAPSIAKMFLHQSGLSRLGRRVRSLEGHYLFAADLPGGPRDVDWVSGGCLMVPLALWRRIGGLSDRWFMYAEDVEFCLRIRAEGLRVVLDPRLHALHAMGGSSSGVDGRVGTAWIVNLFDLYGWRMARGDVQQRLWRAVVLAGMRGRMLWFTVAGRRPGRAESAAAQIHRFRVYAAALRAAPLTRDREPLLLPR
ncbi:glycosyltransferase family 2 protein [Rathayibacter sp. VKM Ac-2760]|uniref:glycosyltransferase family 2 protein n=1 Tax=Rathayibacter sp. VKM Ac-2760 TaxID=2609253 RepID=UPI001316F89D|nr:glycosyltransferase family 2 protein [Rathayibacter sp. VKM Ac-2760]QHC57212.1 glycosyltransferase [Rathayibacter sp. VKM Ac-2760]